MHFKLVRAHLCLALLAAVVIHVEYATANDAPIVEESSTGLRAEISIDGEKNQTIEGALKNTLLAEKLIKMGRARSQGCTRCHGRSGMYSLARESGWKKSVTEFVVVQLTEFREGRRSHEVMTSVAKTLSDQDIALIAVWYQSVSPAAEE